MHLYHMLSFQLDANDFFHHLLFVPIIGGMNFCYPNGKQRPQCKWTVTVAPSMSDGNSCPRQT